MQAMLIGGPLDKQVRKISTDDLTYTEAGETYEKQAGLSQLRVPGSTTNINFYRHSSLTDEAATEMIGRSWDEVDKIVR
jgi:hypothetical protein